MPGTWGDYQEVMCSNNQTTSYLNNLAALITIILLQAHITAHCEVIASELTYPSSSSSPVRLKTKVSVGLYHTTHILHLLVTVSTVHHLH